MIRRLKGNTFVVGHVVGIGVWVCTAAHAAPIEQDTFLVTGGSIELTADAELGPAIGRDAPAPTVLSLSSDSMFRVIAVNGELATIPAGEIAATGVLPAWLGRGGAATLELSHDPTAAHAFVVRDAGDGVVLFWLSGASHDFSAGERLWTLAGDVHVSGAASDTVVGRAVVRAQLTLAETIYYDETGEPQSAVLHPMGGGDVAGGFPGQTEGPDVIVGDLPSTSQFGRTGPIGSGMVGLAVGTTSC
ncbi:MAG: hypothetical protein ACE5E6_12420, partial [Phycisphaerae bacterium]